MVSQITFQDVLRRSGFSNGEVKGDPQVIGLTVGGKYLLNPATLTNGQFSVLTFTNDQKLRVDASFSVEDLNIGGVYITPVNSSYDTINLTYVPSGAAAGEIATVVYKLSGATIATLTLSYNGTSGVLESVVRS